MKIINILFPRSCNEAKRGVEFRKSTRNFSKIRRKVEDRNVLMVIVGGLNTRFYRFYLAFKGILREAKIINYNIH